MVLIVIGARRGLVWLVTWVEGSVYLAHISLWLLYLVLKVVGCRGATTYYNNKVLGKGEGQCCVIVSEGFTAWSLHLVVGCLLLWIASISVRLSFFYFLTLETGEAGVFVDGSSDIFDCFGLSFGVRPRDPVITCVACPIPPIPQRSPPVST